MGFSVFLAEQIQVEGSLEPIPEDSGYKAGETLDRLRTNRRAQSHTHTLQTIWSCQSAYNACLWIGGGERSTRRKLPNQTANPRSVRKMC
ncbi:hypothetical protein AMELA_G00155920 [Ameiurus melas]|uniref:Uncharacterized protein n=1 Tax=Ameiurus melas TaxID=219545 RepID=A0A7J6ADJ3_AMEME|nr:hypothetical protein AMELA_G00155920 [Ameiurus melas]